MMILQTVWAHVARFITCRHAGRFCRGSTAVLLLALSTALLDAAERNAARLLTIGNSFADDATAFLPELARSGGKQLVIFRANLGGASLERHARHLQAFVADPSAAAGRPYQNKPDPTTGERRDFSLPEALAVLPWDYVTVQQVSHESFRPESFHPHVDQLITAIREHAPSAEILIHETWAYREDHPIFQKSDGFTPQKMYAGLRATYRQLADDTGFRLLPVGDAFQLARQTDRWSYVADTAYDFANPPTGELPDQSGSLNVGWLWRKDEAAGEMRLQLDAIHANVAGRYLGAAVFYLVVFEAEDVPAGFLPAGLSADDAAALRQLALKAVEAQRVVTPAR